MGRFHFEGSKMRNLEDFQAELNQISKELVERFGEKTLHTIEESSDSVIWGDFKLPYSSFPQTYHFKSDKINTI
jgi:hypothetical protein